MARTGSPYRNDGLLWLRGIAAFTVVAEHLGLGPNLVQLTGWRGFGVLAASGSYSVQLFFCLSGYLMAKVLTTRYAARPLDFYRNRALRILPTYYVTAVIGFIWMANDRTSWPLWLLYSDYVAGSFGNYPLWSIATEVQFYALCPLLLLLTRRNAAGWLAALAAGSMAARAVYWALWQPDAPAIVAGYRGLESNLVFFAAGWAAFHWRDRLPRWPIAPVLTGFVGLLGVLWLLHKLFVPNIEPAIFGSALWMLWLPMLVAAFSLVFLPSLDAPVPASGALLNWLGRTAYAVYAVHVPVNVLLGLNPWLALVACYAAATALHLLLERPIDRLRA